MDRDRDKDATKVQCSKMDRIIERRGGKSRSEPLSR
jgi:hypothetical protein